jgi:hypothetical protein
MKCEKCGQPLIKGEYKLCVHCRNKLNRKAKIASMFGFAGMILAGVILGLLGFGGKNNKK